MASSKSLSGTFIILAPKALIISTRSFDIFAGIYILQITPREAAAEARAIPVFPDVASQNTVSEFIFSSEISFSIRNLINLSLTEPVGLYASSFP